MQFWGIEIKPGGPVKVHLEDDYMIYVSQVTLGESIKVKDETVPVYVKVGKDESRFVIGNLSQKFPQVFLDLIFEKDFELSHNCKTSSVYLLGYKALKEEDDEHNSDSDSEEEDVDMDNELENAPAPVSNDQKAIEAAESDSDDEDETYSDDEMGSDEDDSEEEEGEEDKAPLKVEPPSKKQPNGGAMKQKTKRGHGCCVPPKAGRQ